MLELVGKKFRKAFAAARPARCLALLLSAVLMLSLSACGESASAAESASASEPVSEAVSEPAGASAADPAGEASPDPVSEASADPVSEASADPAGTSDADPVSEASGEPVSEAAESSGTPSGSSGGRNNADLTPRAPRPQKYKIPEFLDAEFDASAAQGNAETQVDLSHVSEGYVAMICTSSVKIKFQVIKDDLTYTYSVVTGEEQIFPLQSGNGHYVFRVMKNTEGKKYAELYRCEADVTLLSEFEPYLRPNQYANYTEETGAVKTAREFAKSAKDAPDFITKVYDYICSNVTYDDVLAETVTSGYLPDPDRTIEQKKGICFDYACLTASMLRSQGIPTKIIFGYVAPDDLYHAWNMFYTEETGWVAVEFKISEKAWNRIDLTFSANGADSQFIGNGTNYMDVYQY